MSKYTTQVRYICEKYAGKEESVGYDKVDEVIEASMGEIFEEYPIFDEEYREVLNKKILRHYYTREICSETVGLWKLWLNNRMKEIMPYYNKMYESDMLKYIKLDNVDLKKVGSRDVNGREESSGSTSNTSERMSNSTGDKVSKFSDTPQGGLDGVVTGEYLTTATVEDSTNSGVSRGKNSGSSGGTRSSEGSEGYFERLVGMNGLKTPASMVLEMRKAFVNIDEMIIEELKDLFFGLWE